MLLCDIGNTSYHFLDKTQSFKKDVQTFDPSTLKEKIYFISVNIEVKEKLEKLSNWIDLSTFIEKEKYYDTMGIDRIVAIEAVDNGVILDAGSAITIDIVKNGVFEGGFIYPGVNAMNDTYKNISLVLDYQFNFDLDLTTLAKNSQDAISYGFLKTLYSEVISHNAEIVLTGGDALVLKKVFVNARINEELLFDGMKKIIKESII